MHHEFVFTPSDLYRIILAMAGFIVSVAAAVKVITDIIKKAKEPDKIQNDRITSLEGRVTTLETSMQHMTKHQRKAEECWVLYMEAMLDIMDHMIYGNHTDQLKQTQKKMREYMAKYTFIEDVERG